MSVQKKYIIPVLILVSAGILVATVSEGSNEEMRNNFENAVKSRYPARGEITIEDERNVSEGLNLFNDRAERKVQLMDNNGSVIHEWGPWNISKRFNNPLVLEGGDLIRIDVGNNITRYDRNSEVVWSNDLGENGPHHDADIYGNSSLLAISWQAFSTDRFSADVAFDEVLKEIDTETGEVKTQASIFKMLRRYPGINVEEEAEELLEDPKGYYFAGDVGDVFRPYHCNSIYVLNEDYGGKFKRGRVLVSLRNIDTVALIDIEDKKIVWTWGEEVLDGQHNARVTEKGTVMVYDNGLNDRNYSRVLEIDPDTEEIVWSYNMNGTENFRSQFMGSAQPLENGNILITESMKGRAFEITREGEKVWGYDLGKPNEGIFKMQRVSKDCVKGVFNGDYRNTEECEQG